MESMESMLALRIKLERKKKGLLQSDLANMTGFSKKTVGRWELGERIPNANDLCKLADVLETSVAYLIGEEDRNDVKATALNHSTVTAIETVGEPPLPPQNLAITVEHEDGENKTRVSFPPNTSADVIVRVVQELKGKRP